MRGARFAVAALTLATVTACGDRAVPSATSTDGPARSVAFATAPLSTVPSAAEPSYDFGPPGPTAAAAHGYVPGLDRSTGSDGAVTYDVQVPTVRGGSASATHRFTESMRASLAERVGGLGGSAGKVTVVDGRIPNGESSRVTHIGGRVIAGLLLTNYFMQGAAHPNNQIGTVVINTVTAQPILLEDVLPTADARARVAEMLTRQAAASSLPRPFTIDPARDLANWLPSRNGITFYLPVAHAAGDYRPLTVPWFDFRRLGLIPADVASVLSA